MRLPLIVLALALAGCGTVRGPAVPPDEPETAAQAAQRRQKASKPTYNLAGYPPAVRAGYIDGCESAKKTEYARKDAKRFASEPQYAMGWNDGFAICGQEPKK